MGLFVPRAVESSGDVALCEVAPLSDLGRFEPLTFIVDLLSLRSDFGALDPSLPDPLDPAEAPTAPPIATTAAAMIETILRLHLVCCDKVPPFDRNEFIAKSGRPCYLMQPPMKKVALAGIAA